MDKLFLGIEIIGVFLVMLGLIGMFIFSEKKVNSSESFKIYNLPALNKYVDDMSMDSDPKTLM